MGKLIALAAVLALVVVPGCDKEKGGVPGGGGSEKAPAVTTTTPTTTPVSATDTPVKVKKIEVNWLPTSPDAVPYNPQDGVVVSGKALFKGGKFPKRKKIDMSKDEKCTNPKPLTEEEVVDKETKGIANVLVFVSKGYETVKFETPKEAFEINQEGCTYKPHVFAIMQGQKIKVKNADDTTHNIHGLPQKSKEFNFTQNKKGAVDEATLENPENQIKIKCDIHPWMGAWAFVLPHPLHAVTNDKGEFKLPPLPTGKYVITAWHEVYGELKQEVTVEKEAKKLTFEFEKKDK